MLPTNIIQEGRRACILAELSYNKSLNYKGLGYHNYMYIDQDGTQCHIMSNNDDVVIVFPGTVVLDTEDRYLDIRDILYDIDFQKDEAVMLLDDFGIHRGVNRGLNVVWEDVADTLCLSEFNRPRVTCIGHSLGAGYASETARRLDDIVAVHTFGMFKIYDKAGHEKYPWHNCHYNWVNCSDFVSRFPLINFMDEHLGNMLYITRDGYLILDPSSFTYWKDYIMSPIKKFTQHTIASHHENLWEIDNVREG